MKQKIFYATIVIAVIIAVLLGYLYFSSQAAYTQGIQTCPKWKCTDIKTYTCPINTVSYTCVGNLLTCDVCTPVIKSYVVTETAVVWRSTPTGSVQVGIYNINGESAQLAQGEIKTLSDGTVFGVSFLLANYSAFYLQSVFETKSSWLAAPYPKSTTIDLKVSTGCGRLQSECPIGYSFSCSGSTLTCTGQTNNICSSDKPFSWCTQSGSCKFCPV